MQIEGQELRARRFQGLMPYRVREILLVSSPFDAFILEEDGLLTEQHFLELMDVSERTSPRFTHVPTGKAALRALKSRPFDLVLTLTSLSDMDINTFGRKVKKTVNLTPVVLLALDAKELHDVWEIIDRSAFDGAFLWSGDAKILLPIIKYVEDLQNVDHDIEHGDVRVVIMLEDSPRYYSSFLGLLYRELMVQSRSLYSEGIDELHRQMYMKSRPKILHATTYERGIELFRRYKRNLMAVICDLRIPRDGVLDDDAGLDFVKVARRFDSQLPVLLQSAEGIGAKRAAAMDAVFVDKNSPSLLAETRQFLRLNLGFGDFVFRNEEGEEIARARDLRELEERLAEVPPESIVFHASHNHFSIWLQARSEFELADELRPQKISDFQDVEASRQYLMEMLRSVQRSTHRGVVADFSRQDFTVSPFSRLGQGALGGKARGIAFFNRLLTNRDVGDFGGIEVRVPQTVVLTTDFFDQFVEDNDLRDIAGEPAEDRVVADRFLAAELPEDLVTDLRFLVEALDHPLAVRSSSLLEDSLHQVLAGVYTTLMLPNNARDRERRLADLAAAVKLVYASIYYRNARAYLETTGHLIEEEKMGILIQPVVGNRRGSRFYPEISGVAQSYNYYPLGPQQPDDGVVHLALGLGRFIVDGGRSLRFSPRHPRVLPQLANPEAYIDASQRDFFALDMRRRYEEASPEIHQSVRRYQLQAAEKDEALDLVASVYSLDDDRLVEDLGQSGPRAITFANVLQHEAIPLAEALDRLLDLASEGLGGAVEIEFAFDRGFRPRGLVGGEDGDEPSLWVLQVRPFATEMARTDHASLEVSPQALLCISDQSLGHLTSSEIRDLVYVRRDRWDASDNKAIAREVEQINRVLHRRERPYILIGPGRWGSSDPWLGIPVEWSQISSVKVIVEASPRGYHVEPSQGTHFFHNMTSLRLGYLTLPPGVDGDRDEEQFLDWRWLDDQEAETETEHLRHLRFEEPFYVALNAHDRRGIIGKPGTSPNPNGGAMSPS